MTQYKRVKAVLEHAKREGKPLALHHIKAAIYRRFRRVDSEAAISARIRDIRADLELEGTHTIESYRASPEKHYHVYQIVRVRQAKRA